MRVWGNRSLGCRPASTQKRAAGFGRQFKNCAPSAAPQGVGAHQSGSLSRLPRKPIGEGQNVEKRRASPLTKRLIR